MTTNAKRIIRWIAVNTSFATVLYAAIALNMDGAKNLAQFYCWSISVLSVVAFNNVSNDKKSAKYEFIKPNVKLPEWLLALDMAFDLCVVAVLAWSGWTAIAIAYFLHAPLVHAAIQNTHKEYKRRFAMLPPMHQSALVINRPGQALDDALDALNSVHKTNAEAGHSA